jgi:hypothetical protein
MSKTVIDIRSDTNSGKSCYSAGAPSDIRSSSDTNSGKSCYSAGAPSDTQIPSRTTSSQRP